MQPTPIEWAILRTIIFFDLFNYPMTLPELWQNLPCEGSQLNLDLSSLEKEIKESLFLNQALSQQNGFCFVKGRDEIIKERGKNYRESLKKINKAARLARLLRFIPFIKGIAFCNALGYLNSRSESDIDFAILVKPGSIWTTRLLTVLLTIFFASRPRPLKTKDAICLSFFCLYNQNIESLKLKPADPSSHERRDDPEFDWWVTKFLPIYDEENFFGIFFKSNPWVSKMRPNTLAVRTAKRFKVKPLPAALRRVLEILFSFPARSFWEKMSEKIQIACLPEKLRLMANLDTRVVLNDFVLKFHVDDKRDYHNKELLRRSKEVLSGLGYDLPLSY